ncbi:hypothetical protein CEUSTIGMA_g185.t1 [Chlamydomonas eustigma]|uniref:RNA helicase n=1 Tax=Chlamydomonas eustigma TaxID=1157962 RepID=A0A250WPV4_9CHLO|nr:hypothetical protein CEUSTIGMA_g185.t1 [Chlamydomonas eustigma]|eukprot:GAX72729.1 hypothetical protein CEUSTIGMA_g185.t1 [Chlamydomonas eustigma]
MGKKGDNAWTSTAAGNALTSPRPYLLGPKTKPPPAKKIFSDIDPVMEAYSNSLVTVTEAPSLQTSSTVGTLPSANFPVSPASMTTPPQQYFSQPSTPLKALASFNELSGRLYAFPLKFRLNMAQTGLKVPTPIQKHMIPAVNAGRDILASAHTGMGKTAAYLVPILGKVMQTQRDGLPRNRYYPSVVILQPTRELVQQVHEEVARLIRQTHLKAVMLNGGNLTVDQVMGMRGGVDIVVATPGRLQEFVSRKIVKLGRVKHVVIDEADKMLDLGFEPGLRRLLSDRLLPTAPIRQTLMLSATLPADVCRLAGEFLHTPLSIQVGIQGGTTHLIDQRLELVQPTQKLERLVQLLSSPDSRGLAVVFTNNIPNAKKVHALLSSRGMSVGLLHGDQPQMLRDEAMTCFKFGVTSILVCTNLAARGVDIPDVSHVINFDTPMDADQYIHRIGRTGRAGKRGMSTTLMTLLDGAYAQGLIEVLRKSGQEVPAWLAELAHAHTSTGPISGGDDADVDGPDTVIAHHDYARSVRSSVPGMHTASKPRTTGRTALRIQSLDSHQHPFGGYLPSERGAGPSELLAALMKERAAASRSGGTERRGQGDSDLGNTTRGFTSFPSGSKRSPGNRKAGLPLSDEERLAASAALLARWQAVIHGRNYSRHEEVKDLDTPFSRDVNRRIAVPQQYLVARQAQSLPRQALQHQEENVHVLDINEEDVPSLRVTNVRH